MRLCLNDALKNNDRCKSAGEIMLSVFIAICLLCDLLVCSPPSALRDAWLSRIHPVLDYVSLLPRFNMFAPDPGKKNCTIEAGIIFGDGTERAWRYPDINSYREDFWLPQIKARYQYWRAYVSDYREYPFLPPGCAAYAARLNSNPANEPRRVKLYLLSQDILLPGQKQGRSPTRELICDYLVKPGDLK